MTEPEVVQIIQDVCKSLSQRFKFGYYEAADIEQEGFLIGMQGLEYYDGIRPLANFLYVHIRNRLKNLLRKEHFRQPVLCKKCERKQKKNKSAVLCEKCARRVESAITRQNLMSPIDLDAVDYNRENAMLASTDIETMADDAEALRILEKHIARDLWADFLRVKDGGSLSPTRRQNLMDSIKSILTEHGFV